ncbi:unnamed protein product, partial [Ectocarpus sp. 4 AP-2014]
NFSATFDEYVVITDAKILLDELISADKCTTMPMNNFVDVFKPHADLVMTKNPELISGGGFDKSKEWTALEDENKNAIWNYLQQLSLTGQTILSLPGDVLSSIESLAQGCMKKVEDGELTKIGTGSHDNFSRNHRKPGAHERAEQ